MDKLLEERIANSFVGRMSSLSNQLSTTCGLIKAQLKTDFSFLSHPFKASRRVAVIEKRVARLPKS
jgi:hypothetical protein